MKIGKSGGVEGQQGGRCNGKIQLLNLGLMPKRFSKGPDFYIDRQSWLCSKACAAW